MNALIIILSERSKYANVTFNDRQYHCQVTLQHD